MESFSQLSTFLEGLISNPGDTQQLAQLNSRLERARPSFLSLLDVPAKNSKEKEELEKGLFISPADWTDLSELTFQGFEQVSLRTTDSNIDATKTSSPKRYSSRRR